MYRTAYFCVNCDGEMSDDTRRYNNGRCPLCGFKHPHARTFVACYERGYRLVPSEAAPSWWEFWKRKPVRREFI